MKANGGSMSKFHISKCSNAKLSDAMEFVRKSYGKRFGTDPGKFGDTLLVAISDNKIQGVIAVDFGSDAPFELESCFIVEFGLLGLKRALTASFGRWVSQSNTASIGLAFAAVKYSLDAGKTHCLNIAKPALCQMLRQKYMFKLDMIFALLAEENIKPQDKSFFLSQPVPCLYSGNLRQWYNVLSSNLPYGINVLV